MRIGIASIMQETNTFSTRPTTLSDFQSQGLYRGEAILRALRDTNTELAGVATAVKKCGARPVPLLYANASPGGRVTGQAFSRLGGLLVEEIERAKPLNGLVLSLHGAMAAEQADDADGMLLELTRAALGDDTPVAVTLDLHANVTQLMLKLSDVLVGYHTYPHVDQAVTGRRAAGFVLDLLRGVSSPTSCAASRPMLLPAETTQTTGGIFGELRTRADAATVGAVVDVSYFPPQPWLDVPELGFTVAVTTNGDKALAFDTAEEFAELAWQWRHRLAPELLPPEEAIERARRSSGRPVVMAESADSTSAGAAGDSAVMLRCLRECAKDLSALLTVVDPPAVAACQEAGVGALVELDVGAAIDKRFGGSVRLRGEVTALDNGNFHLTGPVNTALTVSSGRRAAVRSGPINVLLTERGAYSYDPAAFRSAGLEPRDHDVVVVRSANMFRAAYGDFAADVVLLDTPGASTPRFNRLDYRAAPRPLYPLDKT